MPLGSLECPADQCLRTPIPARGGHGWGRQPLKTRRRDLPVHCFSTHTTNFSKKGIDIFASLLYSNICLLDR